MRRVTASILLLAAGGTPAGCAQQAAPLADDVAQPIAVGPTPSWTAEVTARVRDASHRFVSDGAGFAADVRERRLSARFDADGAVITTGQDEVRVRAVGFGRRGAMDVPVAEPALGACVDGMADPTGACIQRLEYVSPGLTEWWVAKAEGYEQGWTVELRPDGAGPLVVALGVAGASVTVGEDEAWLQGDAGGLLTVSGLAAWDADGEPLPIAIGRTDEGFALEVDDTGARYPVEIDPLYSTASWSVLDDGEDTPIGGELAILGDVNGDGYADVLVSADSTVGAYVFDGSAAGAATTATVTAPGEHFAPAGDVNGDGYADLLVSGSGTVAIYHGSAAGLAATPTTTLTGSSSSYGIAGTTAGDVNGDGFGDVVVGEQGYGGAGSAYVHHGSSAGLSSAAATTLTNPTGGTYFGRVVSGAGDVNADGYDDVLVSDYVAGGYVGSFSVYTGSAAGCASAPASTHTPAGGGSERLGYALAGAGDVDGDGYDDVVVGAYGYNVLRGRAYVYRGSAAGLTTSGLTTLTGSASSAELGYAVAAVGDMNGDGYADILVGEPGFSSDKGKVHLHLGSVAGLDPTAAATVTGSTDYRLGESVAGGGDVNGDGHADVVIGSPEALSGLGLARVYTGSASGALTLDEEWEGSSTELVGTAVTGADVNGDGYSDVVVGAPGYRAQTGRVYVFHGASTGPSTTADDVLTGSSLDEQFGTDVGRAGDVDGDGYDDILVRSDGSFDVYYGSASGADGGGSDAGTTSGIVAGVGDMNADGYGEVLFLRTRDEANIYRGASSGFTTVGRLALIPGCNITAAAPAGDVNGDGYPDVILGCSGLSSSTGAAYVYHSSATGGGLATSLTGYNPGDRFGEAVAGVGDLDGDGYDDVMVGAPGYDADNGRVYVYYGAASGLGAVRSVLTGASAGDELGSNLEAAGDVDLDGYADVYVGAAGAGAYGTVNVHHGSASGVVTTAADTYATTEPFAVLGFDFANAGDTDGDGFPELLVGVGYGSTAFLVGNYADADADGHASVDDCDDADPAVGGPATVFADTDGDGYGDPAVSSELCASTAGWVDDASDCDDANASVNPAGTEVCDLADADEDCDGASDDADGGATGLGTVYADVDGDGHGDAGAPSAACDEAPGLVFDAADCDDADGAISPSATEVCDAADVDEDCDALADDADPSATGQATLYADTDGDGHGGAAAWFCDMPATGYVATSTDCDDARSDVRPGATEVCDAANADEDCDGAADDADASATGQATFYVDADADGHGGATTATYCDLPAGYAATSTDCDDGAAAVHPGATEACDAADADEDCDGAADDADADAAGKGTYYADADGDGFGGSTAATYCDAPATLVATTGDCDDGAAAVNPGATEACDAADTDEDCDGLADDADGSATGRSTYYVDADGDGDGGTTRADRCDAGAGYSANALDCDDADAADHVGATETVGNGDDEDCDGAELCFEDVDGDGLRGPTSVVSTDLACDAAGEAPATATPDCDDADASVGGGTEEIVGDAVDQDCDGGELCWLDADGDGHRPDATSTVPSADLDCDDLGEAAADAAADDCDDADAAFHPGADEGNCADANDYNCDGSSGFTDADADGFAACEECDDARTAVNPDADEVCNDRDDDCDGDVDVDAVDAELWYVDDDGDGYSDPSESTTACDAPEGYTGATVPDCDDAEPTSHPGAVEIEDDGVDQDCDGADAAGAGGDDTGGPGKDDEACGCGGRDPTGAAWLLAAAALLVRRRR